MIEYKVLKELERDPQHTQRSLAQSLDVSLGKVNYVLSGLVEKGIIKARKFKRAPGSIRWQYILTPKGISEKVKITKDYLRFRVDEYNKIQVEIEELRQELGQENPDLK